MTDDKMNAGVSKMIYMISVVLLFFQRPQKSPARRVAIGSASLLINRVLMSSFVIALPPNGYHII